MMAIFIVANPQVFLAWPLYSSVLVTLPVALFLVVPLVFVVTVGEIDLSFPATMGFARLDLRAARPGRLRSVPRPSPRPSSPASCSAPASGSIVVYAGLSSLIATLGMNYMLRGLILIITEGKSIALLGAPRDLRLQDLLEFALRASRCRSSGRSPSSSSRPSSTTATASARASMPSATIRTAPRRWASTSAASASPPSCIWASARRSPAASR